MRTWSSQNEIAKNEDESTTSFDTIIAMLIAMRMFFSE
jgi:hypothetical protein